MAADRDMTTVQTSPVRSGPRRLHGRNPVRCLARVFLLMLSQLAFAAPAEPIRIAVSQTPLSLPIYVADSQGYFAAEGLTVRLNEVIGGPRAFQQMLDGTSDLATASEAVVMFNSFRRSDYAVVATFVTSDDDSKVVTRADSGITRPDQLAGKTVATVSASSSHYYLDSMLLLNGVDPKSVKLRNLQPEAMVEALTKSEVDAIAIWEPFPYKALASLPGAKVLAKSGAYVMSFNLIARKQWCGVRGEDLVRLLRALDRAESFINTEPSRAQAILRDRLQLDQGFVDWIWPRYKYRLALEQSLVRTLEAEARWARREGHVKAEQALNYINFLYLPPLRSARPGAVTIVE